MFNSLQTQLGVKLWDFTLLSSASSITGRVSISLPDDCAPVQVFLTGLANQQINVYLPSSPPSGKIITIKHDIGPCSTSSTACKLNIYDPSSGSNSVQYIIGPPQAITFIYTPQLAARNDAATSGMWTVLSNTASFYSKFLFSVISGGYNNYSTSDYTTISGGGGNYTTASYATVAGGSNCRARGFYASVGGGASNDCSGSYAVLSGGNSNTNSGSNAVIAGGYQNTVSGTGAVVGGGDTNLANANYSTIPGGSYATTRSIIGAQCYASGRFATAGDAQTMLLQLRRQSTDGTGVVLTSDASAAAATNQVALINNSSYAFRGRVIARQSAGSSGTVGDTSGWDIYGVIKRVANAASTALVGTPTVTMIGQDAAASAWTVALTADTTNGALTITCTGEANKTINWVATVETTEQTA